MNIKKGRVFYGYAIVIACFCMMVVWWGSFHSFGVFFESLLIEFGWTRAATATAYSLHGVIFGLFSIPTARLCHRFGPRIVITVCGVFGGLGYILMSQVGAIWQMYLLYGSLMSIGMSGYISVLSVVAGWFVRRRGLMTGVVFSGMGVGMIVLPPLVSQLISIYDWRLTYVVVGIIILVVVVVGSQFLKREPYQLGVLPYGAEEKDAAAPASGAPGLSYRRALRTTQFWLLGALYFIYLVCHTAVTVHIVIHAMSLGVSAINAARLLSVFGALLIVGFIIIGTIGDRTSNKSGFIISFILMIITYIMVLLTGEIWVLYIFVGVLGFACGGMQVLFSPIVAELFGLKSHGVILATAGFFGGVGSAVGAAVAGYIFDITGGYTWAFISCLILAFAGFIITLLLSPIRDKNGADIS